jgi:hypothetical protein
MCLYLFQGAEKDIILMATTRTTSTSFIDNPHRLNVSLTRAKHHLIVVGHKQCLNEAEPFRLIIGDACSRGGFSPNVRVAIDQYNKLELNPRLCEEPSEKDQTEWSDVDMAHALSMREVARSYQQDGGKVSAKKIKHTNNKVRAVAVQKEESVKEDDGFDLSSSEPSSNEEEEDQTSCNKYRYKKKSEIDTDGMSPYTRAQALAAAQEDDSSFTTADIPTPSSYSIPPPAAESLVDILDRKRKREQSKRMEKETKQFSAPSNRNVDNNEDDSDDSEAEYVVGPSVTTAGEKEEEHCQSVELHTGNDGQQHNANNSITDLPPLQVYGSIRAAALASRSNSSASEASSKE